MKPMFDAVKGNCIDRLDINGVDYCIHHEDDCEMSCCPLMKAHPHGVPGDSQCPTCGSVVMSDEITVPSTLREFVVGFLWGAGGALVCLIVLFATGVIQI
jgi:hypothetical protein